MDWVWVGKVMREGWDVGYGGSVETGMEWIVRFEEQGKVGVGR